MGGLADQTLCLPRVPLGLSSSPQEIADTALNTPLTHTHIMPYPQDFEDFLDGIDEEQLLRDIGEDELARQADMFELLQKKEATVEDGQIVRGPPTQRSRHGSQTPQTPRTTHTPSRKHSSSATLADPGQLGKFFDPGPESQGDPAGDTRVEESGQEKAEGSQEEEAFDCTAEVSCDDPKAESRLCRMMWMGSW